MSELGSEFESALSRKKGAVFQQKEQHGKGLRGGWQRVCVRGSLGGFDSVSGLAWKADPTKEARLSSWGSCRL